MDDYHFRRFRVLLEREIIGMSDPQLDTLETIIYVERVDRSERSKQPENSDLKLHAVVCQADTIAALAAHEACPTYRNW